VKIAFRLAFSEQYSIELLNALARINRDILRHDRKLPNLYDSGVVYRREDEETWSDVVNTLLQGHEDCDALAAWRAGELRARGHRALLSWQGGYRRARARELPSIDAEVMLVTRLPKGVSGQYHCIVRYWVGDREYRDDPSLRLGMRRGQIDVRVRDRWRQLGVTPRFTPSPE
jgi:hypothetical protein